ncbi:hypothetical protein ACFLQV_01490 [Calditrichota bacterium]
MASWEEDREGTQMRPFFFKAADKNTPEAHKCPPSPKRKPQGEEHPTAQFNSTNHEATGKNAYRTGKGKSPLPL